MAGAEKICERPFCEAECQRCGDAIGDRDHAVAPIVTDAVLNIWHDETFHNTYDCLQDLTDVLHYVHHADGTTSQVGFESPRPVPEFDEEETD